MSSNKAAAAKVQRPDRAKKKRTPLGARNRLTFDNVDKRYQHRVINDVDSRLQDAIDGGYEFVESDERLGDIRVADASPVGSRVSMPVGGGTVGYLMRIPTDLYEEDQAAKQLRVDATEETMKPDASKGQYGEGLTDD